jgi:cbb3-type cytochrome oxidase cytochrome c subunit
MDVSKPRKSVLLILAVLLVAAWGIIIWVATLVTQTALETLSYIVELAQMTP